MALMDKTGEDGCIPQEQQIPACLQARQWFEKAVDQGHAEAQFVLGMLYNGERVTPDRERACAL